MFQELIAAEQAAAAAARDPDAPVVEDGRRVTVRLAMHDLQGNLIDATDEAGVAYVQGAGDIFPALERALAGKAAGEDFSVVLEPSEAYGDFDADGVHLVPAARLGDPELIVPGLAFEGVPGEAGDGRTYWVTDVAEGMAVLDCNHPLAGWSVRLSGRVLAVGEPSEGEASAVPDFLAFADKIVDEGDEDDDGDEEARLEGRLR